jgi:hypothetical protein
MKSFKSASLDQLLLFNTMFCFSFSVYSKYTFYNLMPIFFVEYLIVLYIYNSIDNYFFQIHEQNQQILKKLNEK